MERPIIFSTEMVRAIIKGRKTQTRRVMTPAFRTHRGFKQGDGLWVDGYGTEDNPNGHIKDYSVTSVWLPKDNYIKEFAPYKPGDILWVRETWLPYVEEHIIGKAKYAYKSDTNADGERYRREYIAKGYPYQWRPSIHMPRAAARLFMLVKNVRIERLQDITEEDARAEGCLDYHDKIGDGKFDDVVEFDLTARDAFVDLWNSTIKKQDLDKYGWDVNPWVWVVEFERV